ncbi:hypothetical protein LAZ67_11001217 [Cordylochernes scorpioides]|uniref:Uncharacterized protein n=1 Tax=Cordylochernes scorpioides TaxID=51811 RepID=A0ABY6KYA6_9ARAC|nr:hypothetical protein LAZ67_11001217 [Cordylochernes scorpioides]
MRLFMVIADADWVETSWIENLIREIVYFLARGPIAWESKKQQTVTLSSTESEYIALCEAGKEAVYLRALLDEMGFGELLNGPTVLKTDNQGAQQLARNPVYHARTKHIDIKCITSEAFAAMDLSRSSTHQPKKMLPTSLLKAYQGFCMKNTLRGLRLYTPSFTVPHKKKSSGVRSGERAGNSIGPFRFEGTVTGINYLTMLADSIFPAIRALYGNDDFYFQLDGAPPHYHRDVRAYLDKNLSGQWIGRRGPIEFPARSPELTPLDFFLWGTVKDGVYKRKPRNLDILWNEIQAVCREISLDVLIRCTESVVTRTQNCIDAAGHQFEQY